VRSVTVSIGPPHFGQATAVPWWTLRHGAHQRIVARPPLADEYRKERPAATQA
jgi:hypothetical protein